MLSVEDLEMTACKDLDLATEARMEERRRILGPLMGAVQFLQGAPTNVQAAFAFALREILCLSSSQDEDDVGPKILEDNGVAMQDVEAWAHELVERVKSVDCG